ncbi:MAG: hypothetical protein RBT49_17760 [Bacteroidales bacterium]|jgi:hypothetical protein|nr:hypothetical protein [Bacteroidales bacterium]
MKNLFIFIFINMFFSQLGISQNNIKEDDFIIIGIEELKNPVYVVIENKNQSAIIEYDDISKIKYELLDSNNIVFEKYAYYYCPMSHLTIEKVLSSKCDSSIFATIKYISDNYFTYRDEVNDFGTQLKNYSNNVKYNELKVKKYLVVRVRLSAYLKSIKIDPNHFLRYSNKPNYNGLYIKMIFPII